MHKIPTQILSKINTFTILYFTILTKRRVTVQWNVNEGPSYSEFLAEKMKKEQREEKEQRAQEAAENNQQEVTEEEEDAEDDDYLGDEQDKNVVLTVTVKKGNESVDFKCSVAKDQQIYLDSITFGDK